jgi:hypothetical protein
MPVAWEDIMRRRGLLLALIVAVWPGMTLAQDAQLGWQQYRVPGTGAHVDLPAAIFQDAGAAEAGSGRRFVTSDGRANLTVQSIRNAAGASPAAFLASRNPPRGIVYKRVTPNFFVVSSFRDRNIWYNRCNFFRRLRPLRPDQLSGRRKAAMGWHRHPHQQYAGKPLTLADPGVDRAPQAGGSRRQ